MLTGILPCLGNARAGSTTGSQKMARGLGSETRAVVSGRLANPQSLARTAAREHAAIGVLRSTARTMSGTGGLSVSRQDTTIGLQGG